MTEKEKKQVKKALERLGYSQKEIHVIFDEYKQCCACCKHFDTSLKNNLYEGKCNLVDGYVCDPLTERKCCNAEWGVR